MLANDLTISSDEDFEEPVETKRVRAESKYYFTIPRKYDRREKRFTENAKEIAKETPNLKKAIVHEYVNSNKTIIVDNGAHTIKIGRANSEKPMLIPNCIMKAKAERKRLFIGNQIDDCRDCSGLFYLLPCEKGYITRWEIQKPIWDYTFSKSLFPVGEQNVLMTQPLFNFKTIQDCIDEIFFEEYEVNSMYRCNPTDLAALKYSTEKGCPNQICLIVDSGYSYTHVIPYINGLKCANGTRRMSVGGKLLTNHLKDILSYRQYHVMEETYVMNQVKEDTCYVSYDFQTDLKASTIVGPNNLIQRNYVLPDFNTIRRGYIHYSKIEEELNGNCQVLRLNNERFTVPELLFTPSDIGINCAGIAEILVESINACPATYREELAKNILLVGGCTKFPGFRKRLLREFKSKSPCEWEVHATIPQRPIMYPWQGGRLLLNQPRAPNLFVTKQEYEELGSGIIQSRFNEWITMEDDAPKPKKEVKVDLIDFLNNWDVFGKNNGLPCPFDYDVEPVIKPDERPYNLPDTPSTSAASSSTQLDEYIGTNGNSTSVSNTPSSENSQKAVTPDIDQELQSNNPKKRVRYYFEPESSDEEDPYRLAEIFPVGVFDLF